MFLLVNSKSAIDFNLFSKHGNYTINPRNIGTAEVLI